MSKELDKIKECLDFFCRRCNEQGFYSPPLQPIVKEAYEAIAALRSEPVAWTAHGIKREDTCVWIQDSDGPWNTSCGKVFEFTNEGPAENEANFCYHCGGALLPEPHSDEAPSREQDQRSEAAQSVTGEGESQHAADGAGVVRIASGTGTKSEQSSDHPTPTQLSAEDIANMRRQFPKQQYWTPEEKRKAVALCDAALSSLTARDEGIEAAAKILHEPWASAVRALKGASHD